MKVSLIRRIKDKIYLIKRSVIDNFYKNILKKPHLKNITLSILLVNFFFQRILRKNADFKSSLHFTSKIEGSENLILPKVNKSSILISFACSGSCYFSVFKGTTLEIGENTLWANNVCIQTANHDLLDRKKMNKKSVKIGKNCWLGFGAVVLPGVVLGDNVTVGANSTVTKSFPSNCVLAGSPAEIIKYI